MRANRWTFGQPPSSQLQLNLTRWARSPPRTEQLLTPGRRLNRRRTQLLRAVATLSGPLVSQPCRGGRANRARPTRQLPAPHGALAHVPSSRPGHRPRPMRLAPPADRAIDLRRAHCRDPGDICGPRAEPRWSPPRLAFLLRATKLTGPAQRTNPRLGRRQASLRRPARGHSQKLVVTSDEDPAAELAPGLQRSARAAESHFERNHRAPRPDVGPDGACRTQLVCRVARAGRGRVRSLAGSCVRRTRCSADRVRLGIRRCRPTPSAGWFGQSSLHQRHLRRRLTKLAGHRVTATAPHGPRRRR